MNPVPVFLQCQRCGKEVSIIGNVCGPGLKIWHRDCWNTMVAEAEALTKAIEQCEERRTGLTELMYGAITTKATEDATSPGAASSNVVASGTEAQAP